MHRVKSCGLIVFRREPELSFLLMRHPRRYDLPKGHVDGNETELECAWRELSEETGLTPDCVRLQDGFRFVITYYPRSRRFGGMQVEKEVVLFLGWLEQARDIVVTEHTGHEWVRWAPPHRIQTETIDSLLAAVERFFASHSLAVQPAHSQPTPR